MIVDVIMPKVGMYEDDVELVEWIAERRQRVEVGDPLFVMETEKVSTEIEAEDAGILVCTAEPGYKAPIGSRIGYVVSTPAEREELRSRSGVAAMMGRRPVESRGRRCARCCASACSRSVCDVSSARATCPDSCTRTSVPRRWP